jgi:hypothetical protein
MSVTDILNETCMLFIEMWDFLECYRDLNLN